jgi:hypothetical protein
MDRKAMLCAYVVAAGAHGPGLCVGMEKCENDKRPLRRHESLKKTDHSRRDKQKSNMCGLLPPNGTHRHIELGLFGMVLILLVMSRSKRASVWCITYIVWKRYKHEEEKTAVLPWHLARIWNMFFFFNITV